VSRRSVFVESEQSFSRFIVVCEWMGYTSVGRYLAYPSHHPRLPLLLGSSVGWLGEWAGGLGSEGDIKTIYGARFFLVTVLPRWCVRHF